MPWTPITPDTTSWTSIALVNYILAVSNAYIATVAGSPLIAQATTGAEFTTWTEVT